MQSQPVGFSSNYTRLDRISRSLDSVLLCDLSYTDEKGRVHTARRGMIFDGGSIPRRLWRVIDSPYGRYLQAYVVHDWYCYRALDLDGDARWRLRRRADDLFYEMLGHLECPSAKKKFMYWGVRIGAWGSQLKRRK